MSLYHDAGCACKAEAEEVPVEDRPADFRQVNWRRAVVAARARLHVVRGSISAGEQRYNELQRLHENHIRQHGNTPTVRLGNTLVWDCIKGRLPYRELSILAAIYSVIGAKRYPVRITRDRIRYRALGYKSAAVMEVELPTRTDGLQPLSIFQIGRTVNELHQRGFFSRARANARQTFYSLTLNQEQLEKALFDAKVYGWDFHKRRQNRNSDLMAKIKAAKEQAA